MKAGAGHSHPNPALLYTLIGLMQVFWTANFLIGKVALREFPALLAAGMRVILALLCILPFYAWRVHGQGKWTRADLPRFLFLGLIAVGINQVLFVVGLSRTSVAHCAILIALTPLWVLLIAAARRLETITARKLAGMLAALAGVVVLGLERKGGAGPTIAGDLAILSAGAAFALFTVLGKEITDRHGSLTVNTFLYAFGALLVAPVVVWQGWSFPFASVSVEAWLALGYMAVFPSLVCYLIFYYALRYVAASRLTTLGYLQPLAATLFGVLLLDERITAPLVAGGALIVAGVYLTERA